MDTQLEKSDKSKIWIVSALLLTRGIQGADALNVDELPGYLGVFYAILFWGMIISAVGIFKRKKCC